MQKITPHLWFDKEAKAAAELYVAAFGGASKINNVNVISDTPSGDSEIVSFQLGDQAFMAISAGPLFAFNPSISLHVKCNNKAEVADLWEKLSAGGTVLMELGEYPFSEKYGWTQDRYGLSWQINYVGETEPVNQKITPVLMFVGNMYGKAEEAINFYSKVFPNAKTETIRRFGQGEEPDKEGAIKHAEFSLEGQVFGAMESAYEHKFSFNEAISFIVNCENQAEIDYFWEQLSFVPEAEQCGWLKDKFGVSWQIVPTAMNELLSSQDEKKIARVTEAFLKMKKFDIAALKRAGESD